MDAHGTINSHNYDHFAQSYYRLFDDVVVVNWSISFHTYDFSLMMVQFKNDQSGSHYCLFICMKRQTNFEFNKWIIIIYK